MHHCSFVWLTICFRYYHLPSWSWQIISKRRKTCHIWTTSLPSCLPRIADLDLPHWGSASILNLGQIGTNTIFPIWCKVYLQWILFGTYLWKQCYYMILLQICDLSAIFESLLTEIWVTSSMANLDFLQFCETAFLPNSKFNWCTKKEGRKDVDRLKQGP